MKNKGFPIHGTSLMVATIVGGGMFALPVAFVHVWFLKGMIILSLTGFLMLATGLILVDINMRFPQGASFHTLTKKLIGPKASILIGIAFCFILYLLTYAYISGVTSIFKDVFHSQHDNYRWFSIIILILTTSGILLVGGKLPGYILSILISAKFTVFLVLLSDAVDKVNPTQLSELARGF